MDGYEVPPKLQEERHGLEGGIAALRRKLKAMKVYVFFSVNTQDNEKVVCGSRKGGCFYCVK